MKELLIPILVNGTVTALVALSFHLVLRSTGGIADFALGQYVIIGGLTAAYLVKYHGAPVPPAVTAGIVTPAMVAAVNELLVIRPIVRLNPDPAALTPVVATVSLLWVWEQIARLTFGDAPMRGPTMFPTDRIEVGGIGFSGHSVGILVVAAGIFIATHFWLTRTRSGRLLRAIGDNRNAAEILGLPVARVRLMAFVLAGFVAGIAGVLAAPIAGFRPLGGALYTLDGFVALFLGGAAHPLGPLIGGIALAGTKILISRYAGIGLQDYIVLLMALFIFAFRPQGLLAMRRLRST